MRASKTNLRGQRVGIFAVDAGRTTGVAAGAVTLSGSIQEIFERDPLDVYQVSCENPKVPEWYCEVEGAKEIAAGFLNGRRDWLRERLCEEHIFFVFEDFVLNRQSQNYQRAGISSARVMSLVMGMLEMARPRVAVNYVPQTPADAKTRWTSERLRRSGLWTVGLEHGRDATRHAALFVARNI